MGMIRNGSPLNIFDKLRVLILVALVLAMFSPIFGNSVSAISNGRFVFARYNMDGSLDMSFGADVGSVDGKKAVNFLTSCHEELNSIAIDLNGKIVAGGSGAQNCGSTTGNTKNAFVLTRLKPDGSLDASFSADGKVKTDLPGSSAEFITSIAIDNFNNKIVVGGYRFFNLNPIDSRFVFARYNTDGSLDTSFANSGILDFNMPGSSDERVNSIAIDHTTGKIVAGGFYTVNPDDIRFLLVRLNHDGSLDSSFAGDGLKGTNIPGSPSEVIKSVAIDKINGKIVVGGYYTKMNGDQRFVVGRYNTEDGSIDTTFDKPGNPGLHDGVDLTNLPLCLNRGAFVSVAIALNHKVAAGGDCNIGFRPIIARYNVDGSLDKSFSVHGDGIGAIPPFTNEFRSIAIDANGKIVGAGMGILNQDPMFVLARYNTNGDIDPNFHNPGGSQGQPVASNILSGGPDFINSIVIDSNGRIVAGGVMEDP